MTDTPLQPIPGSGPGSGLGWNEAWEAARRVVDPEGVLQPVRIAAEHRGAYHAMGPGGTAWVELTGRTFHRAVDKRALPTVGDWALVERWEAAVSGKGAGVVRHILPRRSFLVRKAAGEATLPQPLAANVDVGLVMTSANADLSPARLDRYVGLLRDGGIEPVLVLSKIDLVEERAAALAVLRAVADVRIVEVSSVRATGLDEIRALGSAGKTTVLLGSSGVGKSTLLNALIGTQQKTREIREDERGRHTTTHRELFVAADGGLWIDTPGMRELATWLDEADEAEPQVFDDITALAAHCKFRDCRHDAEPGCAVQGKVTPARLASFRKLSTERATATTKQSEAQRIAAAKKSRKKPAPPKTED